MRNISTVVFIVVLIPGFSYAGMAPAELKCTSIGKTNAGIALKGFVPATESTLELTLSKGKKSLLMNNENSSAHVVEAFKNKVFTMTIKRQHHIGLKLYAIPSTIKTTEKQYSYHAEFTAELMEAPRPGYSGPINYDAVMRNIKMRCSYDYEI